MAQSNTSSSVKNRVENAPPKMFNVWILNDDFTEMGFVVYVLTTIFRHPVGRANALMLDVHQKGKGLAGTYNIDIATSKVRKAESLARENGYPLRFTIESQKD